MEKSQGILPDMNVNTVGCAYPFVQALQYQIMRRLNQDSGIGRQQRAERGIGFIPAAAGTAGYKFRGENRGFGNLPAFYHGQQQFKGCSSHIIVRTKQRIYIPAGELLRNPIRV